MTPKLKSGKAAMLGLSNVAPKTKPACTSKDTEDYNPNLEEEVDLLQIAGKKSTIYEETEHKDLNLEIKKLNVNE
jgi:hypothetical protein